MADKFFSFNSFGGSDCTITVVLPVKDGTSNKTTVVVGNVAAIHGVIRVEGTPRYVMGEADPQGFSSGKRLISGSLVLETLNRSFVEELVEVCGGVDNFKTYYSKDIEASFDSEPFKYADQLPEFDIHINLTKKGDANKKVMRKLIGCKFASESSGIGLSTLDIQEQLTFMARDISAMEDV